LECVNRLVGTISQVFSVLCISITIYHLPIPILLPQRNSASAAHVCTADALFLCGSWASC